MKLPDRVLTGLELLPRPLDPVRSIKLKLGILLVASGATALAFFRWQIGWLPPATSIMAIVLALFTSQVLAHGMTRPLREMTASAKAIARGEYAVRVRATARDEVGELATAFNQMAADLGAADQQRRDLIANVSHELRTPITALQAVLENVVDGVVPADPATMSTALAQTQRLGRLVEELLDLSRLDAGVLTLTREQLELAPLLADMVAEAEVADRGTRFEVKVSPADATVYADRGRLHQVVANLLDNASRHGPRGGWCGCWPRRTPTTPSSRCSTRAPASPPPTVTGCSSGSPVGNAPAMGVRGWGWPLRGGSWTCTAAPSRWSTRDAPAAGSR